MVSDASKDSINVPNTDGLANILPNVGAIVIDDVGHLCNLQAPSAYTNADRRFVEEHRTNLGRGSSS